MFLLFCKDKDNNRDLQPKTRFFDFFGCNSCGPSAKNLIFRRFWLQLETDYLIYPSIIVSTSPVIVDIYQAHATVESHELFLKKLKFSFIILYF
jgi:hypothetical protein